MQVENPSVWAANTSVTSKTKGQRPKATVPPVDDSSRGGSFEPIRNPYAVGFRGAPKKRKKSDK